MRVLKTTLLLASAFCIGETYAQQANTYESLLTKPKKTDNYFNHLDLSLTAGTSGLGFDLAMPAGEYLQVRAGGTFTPHFQYKMKFGVQVGDSLELSESRFQRLASYLKDFTGYQVENHVDMIGKPTMNNFKFMVDVFPFRNKKWHFTAGMFIGSSQSAYAENSIDAMTSLMAVAIYNNMYNKILNEEEIIAGLEFPPEVNEKFLSLGRMGMYVGKYKYDMTLADGTEVKKGEDHVIYPNEKNRVIVRMKTNVVKPYVGFGYGGPITKDKKYSCSFDCGVMFWGGTPRVIAHDGVDLERDVYDIKSEQIKNYVNIMRNMKVYPVLDFRITRRLF